MLLLPLITTSCTQARSHTCAYIRTQTHNRVSRDMLEKHSLFINQMMIWLSRASCDGLDWKWYPRWDIKGTNRCMLLEIQPFYIQKDDQNTCKAINSPVAIRRASHRLQARVNRDWKARAWKHKTGAEGAGVRGELLSQFVTMSEVQVTWIEVYWYELVKESVSDTDNSKNWSWV